MFRGLEARSKLALENNFLARVNKRRGEGFLYHSSRSMAAARLGRRSGMESFVLPTGA